MRFLLDESADGRLYEVLHDLGHDVQSIARDVRQGLDDRAVLERAYVSNRILIAADRHFGRLVVDELLPHGGVIYLRIRSRDLAFLVQRLNHVLDVHAHELDGFVVVTDYDVRAVRLVGRDEGS